mmetsp:Transcript_38022/g.66890  ORF Transcript_38022/g.66890 Transcript_38022/m.66890 type:complete len:203 (-) Transcript_38022:715-1323(-)
MIARPSNVPFESQSYRLSKLRARTGRKPALCRCSVYSRVQEGRCDVAYATRPAVQRQWKNKTTITPRVADFVCVSPSSTDPPEACSACTSEQEERRKIKGGRAGSLGSSCHAPYSARMRLRTQIARSSVRHTSVASFRRLCAALSSSRCWISLAASTRTSEASMHTTTPSNLGTARPSRMSKPTIAGAKSIPSCRAACATLG